MIQAGCLESSLFSIRSAESPSSSFLNIQLDPLPATDLALLLRLMTLIEYRCAVEKKCRLLYKFRLI